MEPLVLLFASSRLPSCVIFIRLVCLPALLPCAKDKYYPGLQVQQISAIVVWIGQHRAISDRKSKNSAMLAPHLDSPQLVD